MNKKFLWVEEYRPHTLDDCILPKNIKESFQAFRDKGEIPNLLLAGTAGVGKTTLSLVIAKQLFGENWQKALNEAGMNSFKEFGENWQKALNDSNTASFKQFTENWQKALSSSGLEQMNAYGEIMKKFAETWTSMWPKSK